MTPRVLIAGGGIGGLTAAIALRRAGFAVTVLERARELSTGGAGILLQANAMSGLEELGVAADVSAVGIRVSGGQISNVNGTVLTELDFSELDVPFIGIHRASLLRILRDHAGAETVVRGADVVGYRAVAGRVIVKLGSGEEIAGDVLVGADGINSAIRAQHLGDGPPRYAGYTCWRGVCPGGDRFPHGRVFEIWGAGQRFGGVHVDGGLYWFAPVNASAGGRDIPGKTGAALLELYEAWPDRVCAVIETTPESMILRNDIIDRPFRRGWGRGQMTLLGDAAHPMTPDAGQGAGQAIEDAVVLARCMGESHEPEAALRRYERARAARTRRFVVRSRLIGTMAQLESPTARWLRDQVVGAAPRALVRRDLSRTSKFLG